MASNMVRDMIVHALQVCWQHWQYPTSRQHSQAPCVSQSEGVRCCQCNYTLSWRHYDVTLTKAANENKSHNRFELDYIYLQSAMQICQLLACSQ